MYNSYFVGEEGNIDKLVDFFVGSGIRWKVKNLKDGYKIVGAKMNLIDKILYRLIFVETKTENWSRLKAC